MWDVVGLKGETVLCVCVRHVAKMNRLSIFPHIETHCMVCQPSPSLSPGTILATDNKLFSKLLLNIY